MLKVIVCDDHPIFREGVKKIIEQSGDITVAEEASTGPELLEKLEAQSYDVVILDISLPGPSGLDVLKVLSRNAARPAVIMLSMHPQEQYAIRTLKAGANGYIEKASAPAELVAAIRKVASGGCYVSATLAEQLVDGIRGGDGKPAYDNLSDREYQIMRMLAAGKGTKEIAIELSLGPTTVGTYKSRILHKLSLKNTAELIRYALENKILE